MPVIPEKRPTGSELAAMSWQGLRAAIAAMPVFYVGCFLIYGFAATLVTITEATAATETLPHTRAFLTSIAAFLSFATMSVAAFVTHRFILVDDTDLKIGWSILRFSLWLACLGLILALLNLVKILGKAVVADSGLTFVIGAAVWVAQLFVTIYLSLLFPSVAIAEKAKGWRDRIATSWARMDGNFWLFLCGYIVAILPMILAFILVVLAIMAFWMLGSREAGGFFDTLRPITAAIRIAADLLAFPIFIVQAALASWLYAWVCQKPEPALSTPVDS